MCPVLRVRQVQLIRSVMEIIVLIEVQYNNCSTIIALLHSTDPPLHLAPGTW